MLLGMSSCWQEDIPQSSPRPQVGTVEAIADDSEVTVAWTLASELNPVDYIITYTDGSATDSVNTGDTDHYVVGGLTNGMKYTFSVQAIYEGGKISGAVSASAIPHTRGISGAKVQDSGDQYITVIWVKPEYDGLAGYTATVEATGEAKATVSIPATVEEYTFEGLVNEKEYTISIVAVYESGKESAPVQVSATPSKIIPWSVSTNETVIAGMPVTFKYDQSMLPASEVKWIIPGIGTKTGDEVTTGLAANTAVATNDAQEVVVELQATVGTATKKWKISMYVKPFVFFKNDFDKGTSAYQGFKDDAPVFSPDGKVVYVLTFNKPAKLYAIDAVTGEQKWVFTPASSASYNGKTVNPVTGDIYFGVSTASHFYCVSPDGSLKWENTSYGAFNQTSFPAVNKDGSVVYIQDATGTVAALKTSDGSEIWKANAGAKGGGLIVNGDELIVGTTATAGGVQFLDINTGALKASVDLPDPMSDGGGFAISPDRKTAYLGTKLGMVCSVDIVNHALISSMTPPQDNTNCNIWELCVSPSGDVFGGSKRGYAFCLSADLSLKWFDDSNLVANGYNYAHPCCDAEGNFYITSGGNKNQNFIYSPTGAVIRNWSDFTSANQKQMSGNAYHNGIFYAGFLGGGSENGAFVAVYVGGEDATTGWPCHGGDICGSCCIK